MKLKKKKYFFFIQLWITLMFILIFHHFIFKKLKLKYEQFFRWLNRVWVTAGINSLISITEDIFFLLNNRNNVNAIFSTYDLSAFF